MASEGPNSPDSGADNAGVGSIAWSNPGNIISSDDARASATLASGEITHYLVATDFDFAIPASATISGIVVEWEKRAVSLVTDHRARIVKGGTVGSTDRADATAWNAADAYTTYGSSSDLWGETWTDTDINATTFGAALAATTSDLGATPEVDHCRITVYYSAVWSETDFQHPAPEVQQRRVVGMVAYGDVRANA